MRLRIVVVLGASAALGACDPTERVWSGDATVGPGRPLVVTPRAPLRAPGPTHEVCVVPAVEGVTADYDSLVVPGQRGVHPDIYLVRPDGTRDRLGYEADTMHVFFPPHHVEVVVRPDTAYEVRGGERFVPVAPGPPAVSEEHERGLLCIWAHEGRERRRLYRAIELRADAPLRIRELRWWSGQRMGFP